MAARAAIIGSRDTGGHRGYGPAQAPERLVPMQANGSPRRVRIERGIYCRATPAGRRYEITYSDSTGRQRWKVIPGGIREARAARADVLSRLARGELVAPSRVTLGEAAGTWLATQTQVRPRTFERYEAVLRLHVLPVLGNRRVSTVSENDVAELIVSLRGGGLSGATISKTITVLGRGTQPGA